MAVKDQKVQWCMVIGVLVLVGLIVYFCMNRKSKFGVGTQGKNDSSEIENFTSLAAGAMDNAGHFLDDQYDLVQPPDDEVPSPNFADLVDQGDHLKEFQAQPKSTGENLRPMERLHRVEEKLFPRISSALTPYNVDIASVGSHKFMVNTPRVGNGALRGKLKCTDLACMIRGDIPITHSPAVCVVAKSQYGRDQMNLAGLMSPQFTALYNKYTGAEYKNLVQHVVGAGQAGGYGGASSGVIMDA